MSLLSRGALGAYRSVTRVRDKLFSLSIGGAFARFGKHTVIQLPVRLHGEGRISLGDGIFIGANSWLQTIGESTGVAITIADGTSIAGNCVISAAESVRIGSRVAIARGTYIADHAHAYEETDIPIADQGIANVAPVEIGDGAWIGENAVVSPGATIGAGAVIAANSVVTGNIPPYSLAIGIPARVVRRFGPSADATDAA
jgi:acetyltransferase-like isoleucine patch superfamily enzyme